MKISRILHAGWLFETADARILFDPIFENPFSGNCMAWPDVKFNSAAIRALKVDAVFISHYHDDHCSFESLNLLNRATPVYMYCVHGEMFELIRELGFKNTFSLKLNEIVQVGDFAITTRLALDSDVDAVFQVAAKGINILNAVDSWLDPSTVELLKNIKWDLVLWPFQTMREIEVLAPSLFGPAEKNLPIELLQQLQALNPKAVVPGSCQFIQESWSWLRNSYFPVSYRQFAAEVKAILPHTSLVRMNPGMSCELTPTGLCEAAPLSWVEPVGPQDVDYHYDPEAKVPPTSEIARHFPALSAAEAEVVLRYCRSGIIERFKVLAAEYAPMTWELRLYDHLGNGQSFFYRVENGTMTLLNITEGQPDWRTEVSAFKLYAALTNGEALSSMYVRINEGLDPALFTDADVMSDILIHCLFTGVLAAYQKAQLKVLKNPG